MSDLDKTTSQADSSAFDNDSASSPGRSTLTSRLTPPARQTIVFRVDSAEAAAAFADRFGPRDRNGVAAGADVAVARAEASSGAPLPGGVRDRFEASTGADLSSVRVHTGAESAQAAHAVGAKAYTVGQDIHFAEGKYAPSDPFGLHLLAHEVAHTVQQAGGAQRMQAKLEVSTPGDAAEVEADRAADAMVSGAPAPIAGGAPALGRVVMRGKEDGAAPEGGGEGGEKKDGGGSVKPGAGFDGKKVTAKLSGGWKTPPVKVAPLKATVEGSVTLGGEVSVEAASDADKDKKPTEADAKEAGSMFAKKVFEAEHDPSAAIQEIEVGAEGGKEIDKKEGKLGVEVGVGVTVKLRGGAVVKGTANLVKAGTTKDGFEISVLTIEASEKFPLATIPKDTIINGWKLNGGINLEFKFTVKPDKAALLAEAIKKVAPKLLGEAAGKVGTTVAEIGASLPAMAGLVGGYITIKSMLASLADWDDMRNVAAASEKAVQGYAGGFSAAVGGKNVVGDPAYNGQGIADGGKCMADQISKIKAMPQFADKGFTDDEIREAIVNRVKSEPEAVYDAVYGESRHRIKEQFLQKWKSQLTTMQKLFTPVESDEKRLRFMMGI